jgi:nucleotide-binding universal stress UspA family protein
MYKRVLLALDGSELAEYALPHAVAQADRFGAELVLLRVLEPFPRAGILWQEDVDRAEKQAMDQSRAYLQEIAVTVQDRGLALESTVIQGQPGLAIVRFAEMNGMDLIVICTRGRSGFSRWLMGSVADRVVRGATVPVLLIPAGEIEIMYKRILLPLDGSKLAERALPHAIAQAQGSGARLVLLRVAETIPHAPGVTAADLERVRKQTIAWAQEYLERITEQVQEQGVQVESAIIEGRPNIEITRFSEANSIDLIVLSSRGRSGFSRWLMGSVADRVVRGATVPVLLVRVETLEH